MITTLVGIDPGVIHTGIIVSKINPHVKEVTNSTFLMEGCPVMDIRDILRNFRSTATFIEGYRPRSNLHHDRQMQKFVSDLNFHLQNSIALDNMDSKNVVKNDLLKLFKLYSFSKKGLPEFSKIQRTLDVNVMGAFNVIAYGMHTMAEKPKDEFGQVWSFSENIQSYGQA